MKTLGLALLAVVATGAVAQEEQYDILTGEKKLACEATLCLMANDGQPHECTEALEEYFKIKVEKSGSFDPDETREARKDFLELCPDQDDQTIETAVANDSTLTQAPSYVTWNGQVLNGDEAYSMWQDLTANNDPRADQLAAAMTSSGLFDVDVNLVGCEHGC